VALWRCRDDGGRQRDQSGRDGVFALADDDDFDGVGGGGEMVGAEGEADLDGGDSRLRPEIGEGNGRGGSFDGLTPLRQLLTGELVIPDAFDGDADIDNAVFPLHYRGLRGDGGLILHLVALI